MRARTFDRPFSVVVILLVALGYLFFASAALGLLGEAESTSGKLIAKQGAFLVVGIFAGFLAYKINYRFYKKYAFVIFSITFLVTLLVFVPGLGFEHGGAKRWISVGPLSFQPAEFLKLGYVLYLAAWLSSIRSDIRTFRYGIFPMAVVLALVAGVLIMQPHTGTLLIIFVAAASMFLVAGGRLTHLAIFFVIALLLVGMLALTRDYVRARIVTFLNPTLVDPLAEGYQIKQSLIAIGSGEIFGRGFGQSVQKFQYLPEPAGDSIFAVVGEETGFVGTSILVGFYVAFSILGLKIAARAPNVFSRLATTGIVILISVQSLANISAMLGLIPISGIPLLFVSQGGTAIIYTLVSVGIVLNISKYQVRTY